MLGDEIETRDRHNPVPAPNTFTPAYNTRKRDMAFVGQKDPKHSYLDDSIYRGRISPAFYNKNFSQTDGTKLVPQYKKKIKENYDVASFLQIPTATKSVSPHTYNVNDAWRRTVTNFGEFSMKKRKVSQYD